MKYCKKCVMPDTRPGIKFEGGGGYVRHVNLMREESRLTGISAGKNLRRYAINTGG